MSADTVRQQEGIRARCVHPTGTFTRFESRDIEQSVADRFEQTVRRHPRRPALRDETHQLTYDQLNRSANRIANAILSLHGQGEAPVGLLIEKSTQVIGAFLGVLKAGKIYVPLDAHSPVARSAQVLRDSRTALLVTNDRNLALARELARDRLPLINVDQLDAGAQDDNPDLPMAPDTLAYILYTSGSTGQPKGVVDNHRNILLEAMRVINAFHICPEDRIALLGSCSFSALVRKLYPGLLSGACVHLADARTESAREIAGRLVKEEVTVSSTIPGLEDDVAEEFHFPKLRLLSWGGEAAYKRDIEFWWKLLAPEAIQAICYSSTEAGSISHYLIERESQLATSVAPVGYPAQDAEVLLLDGEGHDVGFDQVGDIVVRSRYMSPGYWRRPDLTEAAFVSDPSRYGQRLYRTGDLGRRSPDGCLMHMGRKDSQVKIRGYRVELMETQAALMELDTVKQAVVTSQEDSPGDRRLVAYFVPVTRPPPSATAMRRSLASKLPEYMIPSVFVVLKDLPLTPNGKVDKRALPAPESVRPELDSTFVAARTPLERKLADLWMEILELDRVGVHDNFLELGGDSLLAQKLVNRIVNLFGVQLPMRALFDSPTVATMATVIGETEQVADKASLKASSKIPSNRAAPR